MRRTFGIQRFWAMSWKNIYSYNLFSWHDGSFKGDWRRTFAVAVNVGVGQTTPPPRHGSGWELDERVQFLTPWFASTWSCRRFLAACGVTVLRWLMIIKRWFIWTVPNTHRTTASFFGLNQIMYVCSWLISLSLFTGFSCWLTGKDFCPAPGTLPLVRIAFFSGTTWVLVIAVTTHTITKVLRWMRWVQRSVTWTLVTGTVDHWSVLIVVSSNTASNALFWFYQHMYECFILAPTKAFRHRWIGCQERH